MARLIVVCVVAFATAAAAQETDARRFFEQGLEAQRAGNYVLARDHFEASYRLAPNTANAFQLARTLHHLGLESEASEVVGAISRGALSPPLDDAAQQEVERLTSEVEAAIATIVVQAADAGGEARLDGRFVGTFAPHATLTLRVNGGVHTLHLILEGGTTEHRVDVARGGRAEVRLTPVSLQLTDPPRAAPADEPLRDDASPSAGRRRGIIVAVVVAAAVLLAGGIWLAARPRNDSGDRLEDDVFGVAMVLRR